MYCKMCGSKIDNASKFCFNCGASVESGNQNNEPVQNMGSVYYQQPVQNTTDYNALAITFGTISIVFCWSFTLLTLGFGIAAVVMSNKYKNQSGKSGAGKVLGILGIVFSSIALIISLIIFILPFFAAVLFY